MPISAAVSMWTLASVLHALARGAGGLLAARSALGLGEAATYPGAVRAVTQTLPTAARMRGIALVYSGGSLGALLTPILVTPIAVLHGWRAAFWLTGGAGAIWLALWAFVSRGRQLGRPPAASAECSGKPRWSDPCLWGCLAVYALGGSPLAFVLYQSSIYLSTVLHKSQVQIGNVLWLPPLGWELGFFFWGWLTDRLASSTKPGAWLQRQLLIATGLTSLLAVIPHLRSYALTMTLLSLGTFITPAFVTRALSYSYRRYSMSHSGLIIGLASGAWSGVVALEMPVVGRLFDLHDYGLAFVVPVLLPVVGLFIWCGLDWHAEKAARPRRTQQLGCAGTTLSAPAASQ